MGTLSIVSTPIGNLDDITLRAVKTLLTAHIILCEDTRRTGQLLAELTKRFPNNQMMSTKPRLLAYHEHNEEIHIGVVIHTLEKGDRVALVSDAGTPLLSDPGYPLVRECIKRGIPVVPVPGPSSILAALVASGLPPHPFLFLGYPPEKPGRRHKFFQRVKFSHTGDDSEATPWATAVFFASPHKVIQILEDLQSVFGDIPVVIARELTKIHEEFIRKKVSEILEQWKKEKPRGELVVLFQIGN